MRFNKDTDARISDLEKQVDDLRRIVSARKYGNQGGNPVGWRIPWVRYVSNVVDSGSSNILYLEPNTLSNGWFGSEVDSLIHRMPDAGGGGYRGFQIVGRGTWMMHVWVTFSYNPLESSYTSYNRHTGHLWPIYTSTYLTPLGRTELHDHTIWTMPVVGFGGSFSKTMHYCWPFNVKGAVTPDAPTELYLRFSSPIQTIKNGATTTETKTPADAFIMFIRLDSEAKRDVEFLLPGDGEVVVTPPPP